MMLKTLWEKKTWYILYAAVWLHGQVHAISVFLENSISAAVLVA
jgi:hypothetical protein